MLLSKNNLVQSWDLALNQEFLEWCKLQTLFLTLTVVLMWKSKNILNYLKLQMEAKQVTVYF